MIFETHAHFCDEAFQKDREQIIGQLRSEGICKAIEVGASLSSTRNAVRLSERYEHIYAAAGVHPSDVEELSDAGMEELRSICGREKTVAVGEIGLDYHYEDDPAPEIQKKWFAEQMQLAAEVRLPVIIHSREAAKDTLDILKENPSPMGGVIHCYSYSREMAHEFLDLGYYIGVGGVITFKNGRRLRETVEYLPLDRILLETDCPYMAPEPHRGERNSSLFLPLIAAEVARIKGISRYELETITRENAERLFFKAK